jgi:PAS domain S-box-containing protein
VTSPGSDQRFCEVESALLRICHLSRSLEGLMRELTGFFAGMTGCEAVGIRLHRNGDFPYYTTTGFADDFVLAERSLCSYRQDGSVELDEVGNPALACMCGNVIRGRFDVSKPFFTERGSFWTSSTTQLLASTTDADRQARTRNRCNGEGYESVAVIPLKASGKTIGLVQFNDRQPGRFDADAIARLERFVDYVAIAVAKFEAEDALCRSEEKYRIVADQTYDWEFWIGPDERVIYMSPACERITGRPAAAFVASPSLRRTIVAPEDLDLWDRHGRECHLGITAGSITFRIVRADGQRRWIDHVCQPVVTTAGRPAGIRGGNRDVTDHHVAEEARDAALRAQQELIGRLQEALAQVKTLRGFIPICSGCKKIRDDAGYWQAVEVYVRDHTEAEFSHGLCPDCARTLYPDVATGA